jgi:hypothetical protein
MKVGADSFTRIERNGSTITYGGRVNRSLETWKAKYFAASFSRAEPWLEWVDEPIPLKGSANKSR